MSVITFTIPGEPCAKGRPRMTKSGVAYTPQKTVAYENLVKLTYMNEVGKVMPFEKSTELPAQIHVCIVAHFRIPKSFTKGKLLAAKHNIIKPTKKPDADNIGKGICDALNGLAYRDDSCVTSLEVRKVWAEAPCVVVTMREDANELDGQGGTEI